MPDADTNFQLSYEPAKGRVWKLVGAAMAAVYALYRLVIDPSTGDVVIAFVIAFCLLIGELNFPSSRFTRAARDHIVVPLRTFFGYGDGVARVLMMVIAVGGTTLAVKHFFELRLIPDNIDFVVKRAGVALTGVTVALYCAMVVSKFSFELSHIRYDTSTIGHELAFYISIMSFCILFTLGTAGTGYWDVHVSNSDTPRVPPFIWSDFMWKLIFCLCLISVIWSICFGLNVLSRMFEYYRRDRLATLTYLEDRPVAHRP